MPRKSKQEEKLLAQVAAMYGHDLNELQQVSRVGKLDTDNPHRTKSMQMEAVLEFIRQPQGYVTRRCKECKEWFGANYTHVAFCSDLCRSREWERTMKIPWNMMNKTARERWGGEIPVVIHPTIWKNLRLMLERMQELVDEGTASLEILDEPVDDQEDTLESQESLPLWEQESHTEPEEDSLSEDYTSLPQSPSQSTASLSFEEVSAFHL